MAHLILRGVFGEREGLCLGWNDADKNGITQTVRVRAGDVHKEWGQVNGTVHYEDLLRQHRHEHRRDKEERVSPLAGLQQHVQVSTGNGECLFARSNLSLPTQVAWRSPSSVNR